MMSTIAGIVQVVSIVIGVVISVLSFNSARTAEAVARQAEAEKRQAEAAKPFIDLRQKLYLEAVQTAAILANPETHDPDELQKAKKRFRELYVAELSLVEAVAVEDDMMDLAGAVDPELQKFTAAQSAAYKLAHALRDSLKKSWKFDKDVVDNPNN
jgi:hypothetical protein